MPTFPCKAKVYPYLDGTVYDPFPLYRNYSINIADGAGVGGFGLAANDSSVSDHIDVYMDDFKIGISSFGSSELFYDDFSTNDFSMWDAVHTGTPTTVLTVSSAQVHLEFNTDLPGGPDMSKSVLLSSSHNFYVTAKIKCNSPAHTAVRSPGYSLIEGVGGECWFNYYSDGVSFRGEGTDDATNTFSDISSFVAATMDDGSWHTVGVHFHIMCPAIYHLEGQTELQINV